MRGVTGTFEVLAVGEITSARPALVEGGTTFWTLADLGQGLLEVWLSITCHGQRSADVSTNTRAITVPRRAIYNLEPPVRLTNEACWTYGLKL